ncbi:hypothetical protein [Pontibacter kalidii]|uniref:hypothetical protein n=1 Tax=Pontibacter kalidii TaxID=2592049 RepID=UPI00224F084A|nr:hypothetical protein [Pontibacter kalidii]
MSKRIIRLKDALELMENATEPFSIRFAACDRKRGTGGYWVKLDKCYMTGDQPKSKKKSTASVSTALQQTPPSATPKQPHHYENYTRNLKVVPSGQIRKCSIWLIKEVNGMEVII